MQQPRVDLTQATDMLCDNCKNPYFIEVMMIKKVSKLLIGADKDQVFPIPVLQCAKCGHVNEEFIPQVQKHSIPVPPVPPVKI